MRSVCSRSLAMSIWSSRQWLTISSAASCGMRPSRPWTLASAASMSRYFCVRFSSDQTWRISSLEKIPWKIAESMTVAGMVVPCLGVEDSSAGPTQRALGLQDDGAIDHPAIELGRTRRSGLGGEDASSEVEGLCARCQGSVDGRDLARVDAQLGAEAVTARPRQVGEQAQLVVELRRDAGDRRRQAGDARCAREHAGGMGEAVRTLGDVEVEVEGVVERAEDQAGDAFGAGHLLDVGNAE